MIIILVTQNQEVKHDIYTHHSYIIIYHYQLASNQLPALCTGQTTSMHTVAIKTKLKLLNTSSARAHHNIKFRRQGNTSLLRPILKVTCSISVLLATSFRGVSTASNIPAMKSLQPVINNLVTLINLTVPSICSQIAEEAYSALCTVTSYSTLENQDNVFYISQWLCSLLNYLRIPQRRKIEHHAIVRLVRAITDIRNSAQHGGCNQKQNEQDAVNPTSHFFSLSNYNSKPKQPLPQRAGTTARGLPHVVQQFVFAISFVLKLYSSYICRIHMNNERTSGSSISLYNK